MLNLRSLWARLTRRTTAIELVLGDITAQRVDAIVNAAKPTLMGGSGVDGAIHQAGGPAILAQCRLLRATTFPDGLPTGEAVATTSGRLAARNLAMWVIHTVGPVFDLHEDRSALLRSCYTRSLAIADDLGSRSVAFPLISAGVYGWPKEDAVIQAVTAIRTTRTAVKTVRLVVFDEQTYRIAERLVNQ